MKKLLVLLSIFTCVTVQAYDQGDAYGDRVTLPNGEIGLPWHSGMILPDGSYSETTILTSSNTSNLRFVAYHKGTFFKQTYVSGECTHNRFEAVDSVNGQRMNMQVTITEAVGQCIRVSVPASEKAQQFVKSEFLRKNVITWGADQFTGKRFTKALGDAESIL